MAHPTKQIHDWKTFDAPYTQAFAYTAAGLTEFIGYGAPGASKGATVWAIKKLTYDSSSRVTDIQWAGGVFGFGTEWDERAAAAYS